HLQSRELVQEPDAGSGRRHGVDRLDRGRRRRHIRLFDRIAAKRLGQYAAEPSDQWFADAQFVGIQGQRASLVSPANKSLGGSSASLLPLVPARKDLIDGILVLSAKRLDALRRDR